MWNHTGVKPHKCDLCDKTFGRLDSLKKHAAVHSSEFGSFTIVVMQPVHIVQKWGSVGHGSLENGATLQNMGSMKFVS